MWGLPHPREILEEDGSEPWWFESGHDWNLGSAYPHGIETRFRDAGLAPIFGDLDGFVSAAQDFQYRALKHQIETLRWERPISGYVITELNDVQWESNGLMDVPNRPRAFAEHLANLQRPMARSSRGRRARRFARASASRFRLASRARPRRRRAQGSPGASRTRAAWPRLDPSRQRFSLTAGAVGAIAIVPLELEARDGGGRLLSRNEMEFCIVPPLGARRRRCSRSTARPRRRSPRSAGRIAPRRPRRRRSCSRRG